MANQEELTQLQHELETARGDLEDHVQENEGVASQLIAGLDEISRLSAEWFDLISTKEARQAMLNDISNFRARVCRRQKLPRNFACKISEWDANNEDKVAKAQKRWARADQGEEVSSDDDDEGDMEGINLEGIEDEDEDDDDVDE